MRRRDRPDLRDRDGRLGEQLEQEGLEVVVGAVARMRDSDVQKPPGIAEAIDWLSALTVLGIGELDEAALERTLGSVLKYAEDQEVIRAAGFESLLAGAKGGRDG